MNYFRIDTKNRTKTGLIIIALCASFFWQVQAAVNYASAVPPGRCYSRINMVLTDRACPSGITPTADQCILITTLPGGDTSYDAHILNCNSETQESKITTFIASTGDNPGAVTVDNGVEASTSFNVDCEVENANEPVTAENCEIIRYLVNGINILSAVAGMAIIGSIMIAGYQYMTARDNSGQVEAAKKRIIWAMAALGLFLFMYAFLNFVVPGGVL